MAKFGLAVIKLCELTDTLTYSSQYFATLLRRTKNKIPCA